MKRYLVLMLGLAMLAACEEPGGGKDTHTILVQVFDTDNRPVAGASVFVQGQLVDKQTGLDGSVQFEQKLSTPSIGLRVSRQEYVDHVQTVDLGEGSMRLVVSAWLSPVGTSQTIDPLVVSTVSDVDARVDIPPNSFVDETGDPVTGPVEVEFTFIPPGEILRSVGSFRIQGRPDEILLSLGVVSITATSEGKPVNLAPGASVRMSIPDSQTGGNPPAEMPPVWRQNPETGNWEQASMDWSNEAGEWMAQVDALATWNCDYPSRVTCVEGSVMGPNSSMAGTAISGTMSGTAADFLPASTVQTATTGSDGRFCMEVVPDSQLSLTLMCPGGLSVSVGNLTVPGDGGARCSSGGCADLGTTTVTCCFTDEDCSQGETCEQGVCTGQTDARSCDAKCYIQWRRGETKCYNPMMSSWDKCDNEEEACRDGCVWDDYPCYDNCDYELELCKDEAELVYDACSGEISDAWGQCIINCNGCFFEVIFTDECRPSDASPWECLMEVYKCNGWDFSCAQHCEDLQDLCHVENCSDPFYLWWSCDNICWIQKDDCIASCLGDAP